MYLVIHWSHVLKRIKITRRVLQRYHIPYHLNAVQVRDDPDPGTDEERFITRRYLTVWVGNLKFDADGPMELIVPATKTAAVIRILKMLAIPYDQEGISGWCYVD